MTSQMLGRHSLGGNGVIWKALSVAFWRAARISHLRDFKSGWRMWWLGFETSHHKHRQNTWDLLCVAWISLQTARIISRTLWKSFVCINKTSNGYLTNISTRRFASRISRCLEKHGVLAWKLKQPVLVLITARKHKGGHGKGCDIQGLSAVT